MEGQKILHAEIRRPDLRWPFPSNMQARLTGKTIRRLGRRSKYILADLDSDETLLIHFGMSGRMLISGEAPGAFHHERAMPEKHDHVILDMSGGARIAFNDPRRFGAMDLISTPELEHHKLLASLGPEPLSNACNAAYLKERLAGKKTPIKSALLDQRIIAGLGNIYVCEALWRAGVSPKRLAGKVSAARLSDLAAAIRETIQDAIEAGGSSLRDYRQADGDLGYFQHQFAVYDRVGEPCTRAECDGSIERVVQSARSSFYCPTCQR